MSAPLCVQGSAEKAQGPFFFALPSLPHPSFIPHLLSIVMEPSQRLQSFRIAPQCFSSSSANNHNPVHALPARFDSKTGKHFILWRDIQALFDGAKCIMVGGVMVYLMEGDNFERLEPFRIAYHPDTILDVVVPLIESVPSSGLGAAATESETQGTTIAPVSPVDLETDVARLRIQHIPNPSGEESSYSLSSSSNGLSHTKGKRPDTTMSLTAQTSVQAFQGLRTSCIQAIMNGQVSQAEGIKAEMSRHFQEVRVETDKLNSAMKENAALQAKLFEMNETMVEMQKMTLDRLANIQGQIQAVLTQTYELHEYPIPRLFIILPKIARRRDAILNPFSNQFRLYFLCECGSHTTYEGSKEIDKVHLADHPGYDIERPTEFFKKYGPYVLAVMRAVQLGARVASVVVPHISNSTLAQELKNVESTLEFLQKGIDFYTKENIGTMVDKTVTFLEDINQRHEERGVDGEESQTTISQSVLNDAEAIEGVELKRLENFLTLADKERTLGNLYRSVTKEGHVKWVCRAHFRQNYRDQAQRRLLEVVEENSGVYDEQRGKIIIRLATKTLAKAFYSVLAQTPNLQELDITLLWDASLTDIRLFTETILKSTVISLCIQGASLAGPVSDLLNNGRRFDPILQLMARGQLQMIKLRGFDHFFDHVSELSTINTIPSLRVLDVCVLRSKAEMLTDLVKKCTLLQRLAIEYPEDGQAMALLNVSPQLMELEILHYLHWNSANYAYTLSSEIAKLKEQNIKGKAGTHSSFQSLIYSGDRRRSSPPPTTVSVTFSKSGISGISSPNWEFDVLEPFIRPYGWALRDLDLARLRAFEDMGGKLVILDYGAWLQSVNSNGGVSALEFFRDHGSSLVEDWHALFPIIVKSPKLERLEIVIDESIPAKVELHLVKEYWSEVMSRMFEKLGSRITRLDLRGSSSIMAVVDFLSRNKVTLPKLTEMRWASSKVNRRPLEFTRDQWRLLFAPLNLSVLKVLGFDLESAEDFWCGLMDSLPKNGLLGDGTLVALAVVECGRTRWDESMESERYKCQQLSERAPFARLICSRHSVWRG